MLTSHPKGTPPELLRTVARRRPVIGKLFLDLKQNGCVRILIAVALRWPVLRIKRFNRLAHRFGNRLDLLYFLRADRNRGRVNVLIE